MTKVLNQLLIIEVVLVFLPVSILLLAGYVWALFVIIGMAFTLTLPFEYFTGILIIFLGTFGLVGVIKLLLMKVSPEVEFETNARIVFCVVSGYCACIGMLLQMKASTIDESLPFILPALVSIQLLWINRSELWHAS